MYEVSGWKGKNLIHPITILVVNVSLFFMENEILSFVIFLVFQLIFHANSRSFKLVKCKILWLHQLFIYENRYELTYIYMYIYLFILPMSEGDQLDSANTTITMEDFNILDSALNNFAGGIEEIVFVSQVITPILVFFFFFFWFRSY